MGGAWKLSFKREALIGPGFAMYEVIYCFFFVNIFIFKKILKSNTE